MTDEEQRWTCPEQPGEDGQAAASCTGLPPPAHYAAENRGMPEVAKRLLDLGNDIAAAYIEMQAVAGSLLPPSDG